MKPVLLSINTHSGEIRRYVGNKRIHGPIRLVNTDTKETDLEFARPDNAKVIEAFRVAPSSVVGE